MGPFLLLIIFLSGISLAFLGSGLQLPHMVLRFWYDVRPFHAKSSGLDTLPLHDICPYTVQCFNQSTSTKILRSQLLYTAYLETSQSPSHYEQNPTKENTNFFQDISSGLGKRKHSCLNQPCSSTWQNLRLATTR